MDCKEVRQKWEKYVDGELGKNEQTEIQQHLSSCLLCGKELGCLAVFLQQIYRVTEPAPPSLAHIPKANVLSKYRLIQLAVAAGVMIAVMTVLYWSVESLPIIPGMLTQKKSSTKEKPIEVKTQGLFLQIIQIQEHTIWQQAIPNGYITSECVYSKQGQ